MPIGQTFEFDPLRPDHLSNAEVNQATDLGAGWNTSCPPLEEMEVMVVDAMTSASK